MKAGPNGIDDIISIRSSTESFLPFVISYVFRMFSFKIRFIAVNIDGFI